MEAEFGHMARLPSATVLRSTLRLWRRLAFSSNAASTPNRHGVLLFDGIPIFSPARRPSTTHTHTPHKWIGRGRWMHRGPERWIATIVRISIQGKETIIWDCTHFALSVGPTANLAKLLGKIGLPGTRSPTGSYGAALPFDCIEWMLPKEPVRLALVNAALVGEEVMVKERLSGDS